MKKDKIESITIFKKLIDKQHYYYVVYKDKEYLLENRNYEKAKEEAYELLNKFNKNIVID